MPDGHTDAEKAAKLFSVYLRPWVLDARWATAQRVPYITDLNVADTEETDARQSTDGAKRRRLRGNKNKTAMTHSVAMRLHGGRTFAGTLLPDSANFTNL